MSLDWLLTSEALLDMRLSGLHGGGLSICNFFRSSGGRRISMGRDILFVTSCAHIKELSAISVQLAHIWKHSLSRWIWQLSPPHNTTLHLSAELTILMTMSKPVTFLQSGDSHSVKGSGIILTRQGRVGYGYLMTSWSITNNLLGFKKLWWS